jgi:hypothetical protein
MAFHLREPNESDIPALARVHVQTFNETHRSGRTGGPPYELRERQWREAFERQDGSGFCYVIEDDGGELVGFAKGTPHDGGVPGTALRRHRGVSRWLRLARFGRTCCAIQDDVVRSRNSRVAQ